MAEFESMTPPAAPWPDDPALRAVVDTLRDLPPENPAAVQSIVSAAMSRGNLEQSFEFRKPGGYWRVAVTLVAAAALFAVGLVVGRRSDSNNRSSVIAAGDAVAPRSEALGTPIIPVSGPASGASSGTLGAPPPTMFRIVAPHATTVSVVGDFNRWNPSSTTLRRDADGRTWLGAVPLQPGRHTYAFVIDGVVTPDPNVPSVRDADYDVLVSALVVREP